MKKLFYSGKSSAALLLIMSMLLALNPKMFSQDNCKEVIGYYCSWQWYDRAKLVNPTTIIYDNYSILNYAFLYPLEDGSLMITDPWADKNLLLGDINWQVAPPGYENSYDLGNPAYHIPNTSLVYYAHDNNTKVLLSLGGYSLSANFPSVAADPVKRTNFAHWCNEAIRIYQVDGIDIDWEYPEEGDKENFTLLLQEVRDSLNQCELELGKDLLFTAAFGAAYSRMDDVDWPAVSPILDYINLMSYDFHGPWNTETNHNSPLYWPGFADSTFNTNSAVRRLVDYYAVPSEMINIGAAFYGRSVKTIGDPGLNVPSAQLVDNVTFPEDEGNPLYYNLLRKLDLFNNHWDNNARVPYLTGKDGLKTFVSYDDTGAMRHKGEYVLNNNLAGAIIWELTGDYIETSPGSGVIAGTPLVDTLNAAMCEGTLSLNQLPAIETVVVYPNPSHNYINIQAGANTIEQIRIYNISGRLFQSFGNETTIEIYSFPKGLYYIQVLTSENTYTCRFVKI